MNLKNIIATFAIGKAITVFLGLAWFYFVVHALNIYDYGVYVIYISILEIVLLASNLGVYPFAQRYVTEFYFGKDWGFNKKKLIVHSVVYRAITLAVSVLFISLLLKFVDFYDGPRLFWLFIDWYLLIIFFEGCSRYTDLILESLLLQKKSQINIIIRNGLRLLFCWWHYNNSGFIQLGDIIFLELISAVIGFLIGIYFVLSTVKFSFPDLFEKEYSVNDVRKFSKFCGPLYLAQILYLLYSPDFVKLLVGKILGLIEAALFGFAHAVMLIVRQYVPVNLFMGIIRPLLVSRFSQNHSIAELIKNSTLIFKINNLFVMFLAAFVFCGGGDFVNVISSNKYGGAVYYVLAMIGLLLPTGLHSVLGLITTAVEDKKIVFKATFFSISGVLAGVALSNSIGSLGMIAGLWVSEIIWCCLAIFWLKRKGINFFFDIPGHIKLFSFLLLPCIISILSRDFVYSWGRGGGLFILCLLFLVSVIFVFRIGFFSDQEISLMKSLRKSN